MIDFGQALKNLKNGTTVTRRGWNGPNQFLTLQEPDAHSKMALPYIYITTVQEDLVPWLASQTDLLSDDWAVAQAVNREFSPAPQAMEPPPEHSGDSASVTNE